MVQFARPSSDITTNSWTPSEGATLYGCIDESVASDTDYIQRNAIAYCEVGLSSVTDPNSSTGHVVRYRLRRSVTNRTLTISVRLMQGSTEIASWQHVNPVGTFGLSEQTLSEAQANAITDYGALSLRFDITALQNSQVYGQVSWAELEVPDAVAGETYYQNTGQGTISPAGNLPKQTYKTMGGYALSIAGGLSKQTHKNMGGYTVNLLGSLNKGTGKSVGGYVVAPVGSLATAAVFSIAIGGGTISPTGTLSRIVTFACAVGGYALTITGSLAKQTYKTMGGHAMSIIGNLAKQTHKTVGGYSIVITGALTKATIFMQSVGGYAVIIAGSLAKMIGKNVGSGVVNSTSSLAKTTSKYIGKASMAISGALSSISTFLQSTGGGSISPTGILETIATYVVNVGSYVVTIVGSLATNFIAGGGVVIKRGLTRLGMHLK